MAEATVDRWAFAAARVAFAVMILLMIVVIVLNADIAAKGAQQYTNTNLAAPFSALGFLGGMAGLLLAVVVIAGSIVSGHGAVARAMALVALLGLGLYGAMLVGYSSRSKDVALAPGQEKYFCEIDCHIGYMVAEAKREGGTVRVSLRTRFDEHTIAPWRGNAVLAPSPRVISLVDASGHVYDARQTNGPILTTPLRPGESYTSEFTFNLPAEARDPRLLVLASGSFPERVLIGNENSFLHRKVWFRL
ncbi:MAG TPA: hypothetical protein VII81_10880 [Terriglobales bacterium]